MKADEGTIARRYARAIMLYCDESKGHDTFLKGLAKFREVMAGVPLLETILVAPGLNREGKGKLVGEVGRRLFVAPAVTRFVDLLVEKGRLEYLEAIAQRFEEMWDERNGRVRALVASAVGLDPTQRTEVAAALSGYFGKKVLCDFDVDESLYGGVRARVGNVVLDSSIAGRLERFKRGMSGLTS